MIKSTSKKTVIAGLMLAIGLYLPSMTHMFAIPGNIFLPMHIPVFLCSFFCGPVFAGMCGFVLPYLNSMITGMPVFYPNAVIMSMELLTYGVVCGIAHQLTQKKFKFRYIYLSLVLAMIAGRIVYGIVAALLLFVSHDMQKLSVITAVVQGIPGIVIQLLIVPQIVFAVFRAISPKNQNATEKAISMVRDNTASCVVVKKGRIISAESPRGISHIVDLHDKNMLKGTFVADKIIGKAAAIIFILSGIKACFGETVSKSAIDLLEKNGIKVTYDICTDVIENRTGDGMCPMEMTVKDIDDFSLALKMLKKKVVDLSKK